VFEGDITDTDTGTGLMWMRDDSGHISHVAGLASLHRQDGAMDWEEALGFCEDMEFAGHDDWRLPDAHELQSLVDYTRSPDTTDSAAIDEVFTSTPIIDEEGDPDFPLYWTSTTHKDGIVKWEWAVCVAFGEAKGYGMSGPP
jgi:hypothetical protein